MRLTMPKTPKTKESPAQQIKRVERELDDELMRNLYLTKLSILWMQSIVQVLEKSI